MDQLPDRPSDEGPIPELQNLPRELPPPAEMETAIVHSLTAAGSLRLERQRRGPWLAAASFVAVLLLATGYQLGRRSNQAAPTPTEDEPHFALLLYEGTDFEEQPGLREEYIRWASGVAAQGRFVDGEELAQDEVLVRADTSIRTSEQPSDSMLAGFFIVGAKDLSEAVKIASGHPHVLHRGVIGVRPVARE